MYVCIMSVCVYQELYVCIRNISQVCMYQEVVCLSLVVKFTAIRLQGLLFKPRPEQKFETRFLLHAPPCSASGTTTSGTRASPKPGNSPTKCVSEGSTEWVQIRRP